MYYINRHRYNRVQLCMCIYEFDFVYTVHCNQLHKQTNKMHFFSMYLFYNFVPSTCFERPFRSSSGDHKLLCTYHANVSLDTLA
jgi:hypothetical protein